MKTKMKNFLLVAFTALMMVVCALASVMLSPATVSASAEIAISMVDGAYIRVSETDSTKTGIAYQFEMSEEVYEAVEALKTTKDVYYGMVITKADSVKEGYELNEANLFGDEAKYTANPQEQSAEKPYFVNIMGDTLSAETETVDGTEVATYYFTGRMYNIKQTNLTTKFVGLGYIRIQDKAEEGATSVEGEPEYIWATEGDNVRTVATVAENGLAAGEQDDTVKGYVTNAYKKLGIMDAESADKGTAAKPFVIDSEDKYEAFKTAYANDIVNGSNFYFQVNENVDYSHLATDFADRNFNFVYERATTNVIEDFNNVSTTAAAYNAYRGYRDDADYGYDEENMQATAAKKKQNPTAEYHDEFNGKFGVVSLKSTYYGVFGTGAGTDHTGHNSNYIGWNYFLCSSKGTKPNNFDCISMWVYIPGSTGATVTISDRYSCKTSDQVVPCNTWYEVVFYGDCATSHIGADIFSNSGGSTEYNMFVIQGVDGYSGEQTSLYNASSQVAGEKQPTIFTDANNPTVYIDSITWGTRVFDVTASNTGKTVAINAAAVDTEATVTDLTYTVKAVGFDNVNVTVAEDGTFEAPIVATYLITATAKVNGTEVSAMTAYTLPYDVFLADNEVEGFYSAESLYSAYGATYNETNSRWTGDKTKLNDTAEWHATFAGKTGVLSLKQVYTSGYGGEYHLRSLMRDTNYYRDASTWDYISIWLYVAGEENETVEVAAIYDVENVTVNCNEWVEFKISKETVTSYWGGYNYYVLSNANNNNNRVSTLFTVGEGTGADYTVYVDSISYEKEVAAE